MKRTAAALISLFSLSLLLSSGALAEGRSFVIERNDRATLYAWDGTPLTPPGAYPRISSITDGLTAPEDELFAVRSTDRALAEQGGCAILDATGKRLTGFRYYGGIQYDPAGDALVVSIDVRRGVLARSLAELVPCEYDHVMPDGEGGFIVTRRLDSGVSEILYMAKGSAPVATGVRAYIEPYDCFSEGLCCVKGENQRFGYLDPRGHWAIEPRFKWAWPFHGDYAIAQEGDHVGVIDQSGRWVIQPVYDEASEMLPDGSAAALVRRSRLELLSLPSCKVFYSMLLPDDPWLYVDTAGSLFWVRVKDKCLLVDAKGTVLLSLDGDWFLEDGLPENRLLISSRDEDRLLDSTGDPIYQAQRLYATGRANGGALLITCRFETQTTWDNSDSSYYEAVIDSTVRYGLIDLDGHELLPMVYRVLEPLVPGRLYAEDARRWGVIDEQGNWIVSGSLYDQLTD